MRKSKAEAFTRFRFCFGSKNEKSESCCLETEWIFQAWTRCLLWISIFSSILSLWWRKLSTVTIILPSSKLTPRKQSSPKICLTSNSPTPDSAHRFPSPYATTSHSRTVVHCQSSTFCTELHLSSSTSSPTCKEFANLPFLPHPSKNKPLVSSHTSTSTCISSDALQKLGSESEILIENFRESQGHAGHGSSGILHGVNFEENNLALNEQFKFQMLAEDLDMVILDNGENPGIDVSIKSRSTYIK